MESAKEVPPEALVKLLKEGTSFLNDVKRRVAFMNQMRSSVMTIGLPNRRGHFKIKLCDLEKAVRTFKDTSPCGKVDGSAVYCTAVQDDAICGIGLDAAEKFDERLACPICQLPAFGAVMTKKCGHHFHKSCLTTALQSKKQCPMCRTSMKPNEFTELKHIKESRFLYESINDLKVLCPMGCGETIKFEMLKDHVRNACPKTIFLCKHSSCLHHAHRGQLSVHESTCGEAMIECGWCGESIKQKAEADHRRLDCPSQPVKCEYCHQEVIHRSDIESHLDECNGAVPMSMVRKILRRMADLEARLDESDKGSKRKKTS